jgi:carbon-monoxide dehydrogenase small subunit
MLKYEGKTVIELFVNGETRSAAVWPSDVLLDVLREQLGLTGAKPGCENGDCGACTVVMDGKPVKSCLVLASEAPGHEILTVEGLKNTPLQRAFVEHSAFQCGYCTSGFLMAAHALLLNHPDADEYLTEEWLQSNICRCTSYSEIRSAMNCVLQK